jgi:hypothetical protein
MNADDRARLQRILASFDEAGLIALANKGLLRRAQKDLEAGGVTHEETADAILVRGPDWVVAMPPSGPAHASDSTKASGVTRQILAATIYLRDRWAGVTAAPAAPAAETPSPEKPEPAAEVGALEEALLSLSLDDLQKWAGKTMLREVLPLVKAGLAIEVETHAGLTIRLVRQEIEARLLPGPGRLTARALLEDVLTTAPRSQHRRWVLAAVLAFQQSRGRALVLEIDRTAPAEAAGAPRSRAQVLAATQELLHGMAATGLAHPSARMQERLFTLSVSALAVHLPRLARLLRALSDEAAQVLARDASADTARLFDLACLTCALARALAAAEPQVPLALAGQHRTQYDPAGDLELAGVGAYPWQTASGYEGLTVLFWDQAGRRFLTWTTSRPVGAPGRFSMEMSYRGEGVWTGGGPPERLSRSRFTLRQARANPQGRLSASQQTSVAGLAPTEPGQLDFAGRAFTRWPALLDHARAQYPIGLTEKNPLDRLVVLRPKQWGERFFDELQQRFCWRLEDEEGLPLQLTLPWSGVNESSVEFLEALSPARDRLTAVVCRVGFAGRGVVVEPLSLLSDGVPQGDKVLNPAFDRGRIVSRQSALLEQLRKKYGRDRIAVVMTADDEGEADGLDAAGPDAAPPGIQTRLSEVERVLLQTAEAGVGRLDEPTRQRLSRLGVELDRAGLQEMGAGLAAFRRAEGGAAAVLWNGYLCRLHRQSLSLAASGL